MGNGQLIEEQLTHSVIGAFYSVYNALGYGFLEQVYVISLGYELESRGHAVAREVSVPIYYKGRLAAFQRIDMIVDGKLIVEAKSSAELHKSATRQLLSYLRATGLEVGLVLHFGPEAKFHRMVSRPSINNLVTPAPSG